MIDFDNYYAGKRVFITGHTGFKGAWLTEWLLHLGAEVRGYSLDAPTQPSLSHLTQLKTRIDHQLGDINESQKLTQSLIEFKPDIVFHLAAQSIVQESYSDPKQTFATNMMGTINLLEAIRSSEHPTACIVVTSDKCYENREWAHGYREADPMGGYDPYSCSKGCTELMVASYQKSFFGKHPSKIATARAGNVIGGGDWAKWRIVPDIIRNIEQGKSIAIRNPKAKRPWQHVLEPLSGYLLLGQQLHHNLDTDAAEYFAQPFNFGPNIASNQTVRALVQKILAITGGTWHEAIDAEANHEATLLHLSTDKAYQILNWQPVWNFEETVYRTANWYKSISMHHYATQFAQEFTLEQIKDYTNHAYKTPKTGMESKKNDLQVR